MFAKGKMSAKKFEWKISRWVFILPRFRNILVHCSTYEFSIIMMNFFIIQRIFQFGELFQLFSGSRILRIFSLLPLLWIFEHRHNECAGMQTISVENENLSRQNYYNAIKLMKKFSRKREIQLFFRFKIFLESFESLEAIELSRSFYYKRITNIWRRKRKAKPLFDLSAHCLPNILSETFSRFTSSSISFSFFPYLILGVKKLETANKNAKLIKKNMLQQQHSGSS